MAQEYLTLTPALTIDETIDSLGADKVIIVTDKNVEESVIPKLTDSKIISESPRVAIVPGEDGKNLNTVTAIWDKLEIEGATRRSIILNIGGGVVTDLGGFAAATFKRGIRTVNLPTTLLGAVDAATGGKTGINYGGLKNEIGAFHPPSKVIISTLPFQTLSQEELMSGYSEMIKTAIITDKEFYLHLLEEFEEVINNPHILGKDVEKCVNIKDEVVAQDPFEKGLRKILNFGHTAGHAFESLNIGKKNPVTHGKAVAHGMLVALILSHLKLGLESYEIKYYQRFLKENYGLALMQCADLEEVMNKMKSDKKNNRYGEPAFTLLKEIGSPEINSLCSESEITEALEMYVDLAS